MVGAARCAGGRRAARRERDARDSLLAEGHQHGAFGVDASAHAVAANFRRSGSGSHPERYRHSHAGCFAQPDESRVTFAECFGNSRANGHSNGAGCGNRNRSANGYAQACARDRHSYSSAHRHAEPDGHTDRTSAPPAYTESGGGLLRQGTGASPLGPAP